MTEGESATLSDEARRKDIHDQVWDRLRGVYDPEIPINIVEVGLIYEVLVDDKGNVVVNMTLTAPNCPAAQTLPIEVESAARSVVGVDDVRVNVTFDPPWTPAKLSEAARLQLGIFG